MNIPREESGWAARELVSEENLFAKWAVAMVRMNRLRTLRLKYRLLTIGVAVGADMVNWFTEEGVCERCFPYLNERIGFEVQGWLFELTKCLVKRRKETAKLFNELA